MSQEPSEISSNFSEAVAFFDTTFSTHRVSPLYVGSKSLTQERFSALAKQLRDLLVGDVVRGVEVGLDGDGGVMARAGALEAVELGWTSLGSVLGIGQEILGGADREEGESLNRRLNSVSNRQALHISIRYESALCTALLVPLLDEEDELSLGGPDSDKPVDPSHFLNLHLLLFRMPTPLRSVIVDFLSTTFDCRISPLRLDTQTLLRNLERWITVSKLMHGSAASKDVVITLGFSLSVPVAPDLETDGPQSADLGLKSIEVIISPSELQRFRHEGTKRRTPGAAGKPKRGFASAEHAVKRRRVDGNKLEGDWDWRFKTTGSSSVATLYPFTEALGTYFDEHLALNLFDSRTRITKVACGGFVMSETRLKLFSPSENDAPHIQAVVDCVGDMLDRAMARL